MRKVILAVAILLLLSSIPLAVSQPHPGDLDGFDCEGIAPLAGNRLRVLVAYDEGYFSGDRGLSPIGEEPKSKLRPLPTHPETPYVIALVVFLVVIAVVSYYLYKRKRESRALLRP